jgi:hypothetical protein
MCMCAQTPKVKGHDSQNHCICVTSTLISRQCLNHQTEQVGLAGQAGQASLIWDRRISVSHLAQVFPNNNVYYK